MKEMFQIETGIPIPRPGQGRRKYPFHRLKVNESFIVPCEIWERKQKLNSLTTCCQWASYKTGFKFSMRTVDSGIRIWRIH